MRHLIVLVAGCGLLAGSIGCNHLAGKCDCDPQVKINCEYGGGSCGGGGCGCGHAAIAAPLIGHPLEANPGRRSRPRRINDCFGEPERKLAEEVSRVTPLRVFAPGSPSGSWEPQFVCRLRTRRPAGVAGCTTGVIAGCASCSRRAAFCAAISKKRS